MKILFLDESGDHSLKKIDDQYPVFCLAGVIIDENDYVGKVSPTLDQMKLKYWQSADVILHSRDIRKCLPPFNTLLNEVTRTHFYQDVNSFFSKQPLTIIASVILKKELCNRYHDPSNPYEISFMFVIERFLHYLEENNDAGYITIESRDAKSNKDLFEVYSQIMANGTAGSYPILPSRYTSRIQKIEFVTKKQNENGHQIADLAAYPTSTACLYPTRHNPAFEVLREKFRRKGNRIKGYGLKVFP
jgi:hypothetical protein